MQINWFPGHMAKALRNIKEHLAKVDVVIETSDARIPRSSRNPELSKLLGDKTHRILILNKADLADPEVTQSWINKLREENIIAIESVAKDNNSANKILKEASALVEDKFKKRAEANRGFIPLRIMIVGVPNTGKSTLINNIAQKKAAETSNRPGVTRGPQWIKSNDQSVELLDMPGVLWPKLETYEQKLGLAATGAIKDSLLPIEKVAYFLFKQLLITYPEELIQRYKINNLDNHIYDIYLEAARKRGAIMSGGKVDETRFAKMLLTEYRNGTIGRISLEQPDISYDFEHINYLSELDAD